MGPSRDLPSAIRWRRRWLWLRTWGPIRRGRRRRSEQIRVDALPAAGPHLPATEPDLLLQRVRALLAVQRHEQPVVAEAEQLIERDRFDEAAELLERVAAPSVNLLRERAFVEELRGEPCLALAHLEQAQRADPGNVVVLESRLDVLRGLGRYRAALDIVEGLPDRLRQAPAVRAAVAALYRRMGLRGLARWRPSATRAPCPPGTGGRGAGCGGLWRARSGSCGA